MLTKAKKHDVVKELSDRMERQKITIFSDFHGISVAKAQALRRTLKKGDAEYKVAKKTLIDIALKKFGIDFDAKKLKGEVGVAFGYGDEATPAKALVKFKKENETFKILGGVLQNRVLSEKDIVNIAKLPSREVLISQVVGAFQSPLRGLVTVLGGNMRNLVVVLQKIKDLPR